MAEPNGLSSGWRECWTTFTHFFGADPPELNKSLDSSSMLAAFPVADYDSDDAPLVLREEDPDLELRMDHLFRPPTKLDL